MRVYRVYSLCLTALICLFLQDKFLFLVFTFSFLFLLINLLNFDYTLLNMCFKVLSGLPGTAKDLKSLIYRITTCGPSGPSGPSGGDSSLMVSLVGKARHDEIKNEKNWVWNKIF